jgi:hypothetical protein
MGELKAAPVRRCPKCGAQLRPAGTTCWLCHAKMPPPGAGVIRASIVRERDDAKRPLQYGLSSLLLLITFAAIICSLIKMNPGIGVAVAILAVPAVLRTVFTAFRRARRGDPMSVGSKAGVFLVTMVMLVCVVVAAGAACCVAFLLACGAMLPHSGGGPDPFTSALIIGGVGAAAVAIFVTLLFGEIRRRRRNG